MCLHLLDTVCIVIHVRVLVLFLSTSIKVCMMDVQLLANKESQFASVFLSYELLSVDFVESVLLVGIALGWHGCE